MIYKCKQCGFKDMTDGIMAHLVLNRCGKIKGYSLKQSDITDFADPMTQQQFDKELKKEQEEYVKKRQLELDGKKPKPEEQTTINKEGKEVTETGFEVPDKDEVDNTKNVSLEEVEKNEKQ